VNFYVYIDWTLENLPRPFYIGKGSGRRKNDDRRNAHHHAIKTKYGLRREVVFTSPNEQDCFQKEQDLNTEHHTYVHDPLANSIACNYTQGGDGASGAKRSPETRARLAEANRGKTLSRSTRKKLSVVMSERLKGNRNAAKPHTPEHNAKIGQALKGRTFSKAHREALRQAALRRYRRSP
jgi:hypothetical protein